MKQSDWQMIYPSPSSLDQRVSATLSTLKEEKSMKHTFRAVLIAALAIILAMGVALAAQQLGWVEFYGQNGIQVPKAAQDQLNATDPLTFQVGPMTFTFSQLLTDGHIVLSSCDVALTDGSEALYAFDSDVYEPIGAGSKVIANKYSLDPKMTWVEAAKQLNLPLYGVRAMAEVPSEYSSETMCDAMWKEDGAITCFTMPILDTDEVLESLPVTLYMAVHPVDLETGEIAIRQWHETTEITLSSTPLLKEATFLPAGQNTFSMGERDITVNQVSAKQYATGVYLTLSCDMPEDISEDDVYTILLDELAFLDAEGNELPRGLSFTTFIDASALPQAEMEIMSAMDQMPEKLILVIGGEQITLEAK